MLRRRQWLIGAAALPLAGCAQSPVQGFADLAAAQRGIAALQEPGATWRSTGAWNLAQVLTHAAQSIEFSMNGFPERRPPIFRLTVGNAAFAFFDSRGAMSHSLSEPIPGAPALVPDAALDAAALRCAKALRDFEACVGGLTPHFTYGPLDKAQYTRAHLMHLANHWTELVRS